MIGILCDSGLILDACVCVCYMCTFADKLAGKTTPLRTRGMRVSDPRAIGWTFRIQHTRNAFRPEKETEKHSQDPSAIRMLGTRKKNRKKGASKLENDKTKTRRPGVTPLHWAEGTFSFSQQWPRFNPFVGSWCVCVYVGGIGKQSWWWHEKLNWTFS